MTKRLLSHVYKRNLFVFTLVIIGFGFQFQCIALAQTAADSISTSFPDRVNIDRAKLQPYLEASKMNYSYKVSKDFTPTDPAKPPPVAATIALTYRCDSMDVFVGWRENWIVFKASNIMAQKGQEIVLRELRSLVNQRIIEGLTESDLIGIQDALNTAVDWEFGIEIAYKQDKWQQVFPKTLSAPLAMLEDTTIYKPTPAPTPTSTSSPPPAEVQDLLQGNLLLVVLAIVIAVALVIGLVIGPRRFSRQFDKSRLH